MNSVAARRLRSRPAMYIIPDTITSWSVVRMGKSARGIGWAPIAVQMALVDFTSTCATSVCAFRSAEMRIISTRASFGNSLASSVMNCDAALLSSGAGRSPGDQRDFDNLQNVFAQGRLLGERGLELGPRLGAIRCAALRSFAAEAVRRGADQGYAN